MVFRFESAKVCFNGDVWLDKVAISYFELKDEDVLAP